MRRITLVGLIAVAAAGAAGYWAGHRQLALPDPATILGATSPAAHAAPVPTGPVVYYRHPDGLPEYAAEPRHTADHRAFVAVRASEDVSFDEQPAAPVAQEASGSTGRRILYYRNPMGLPDTSPVPRKDSMGMDYVPVYEDEAQDDGIVRVSLGKLQRTGVRSELVVRRPVTRAVRLPGTLQLDERRVAVVTTRATAFIEKVENVTTGDRVTKGQPLLRLYSPEIAGAGAQYVTDLSIDGRNGLRSGARQRLMNLDVPEAVIREIERTRNPPLAIAWPAPRDGLVLERAAVDGMKADPGQVLFRLADTSTLWVLADIPEYDLGFVELGAAVTIRVNSYPDRTFRGRVALIYPQINPETRTARARIELANPDGLLLPDMYAEVEIAAGAPGPVVAVRDSAVIDSGTRQVVIVDQGDGRFEPRAVKLGRRGGGFVEIRSGVAEGDRVVVAANFLIDAESNLKAALRGLTAPETGQ